MPDFGTTGYMTDAIIQYISTPEGQEKVTRFLSSPEGMTMLKNFTATPAGKKVVLSILPQLLEGLDLPSHAKDAIKNAIPR
jgi:hypothetical protein